MTRGLLIYLDFAGLIRLHWSQMILGELARALVETGRKKTLEDAKAHEARMQDALPHALVAIQDVQARFPGVVHAVRSAKDIHVAACAYHVIVAGGYAAPEGIALVTRNIKDFRKGELARLGIGLRTPDEFLATLFQSESHAFSAAFRNFRMDLSSRPRPQDLLERMRRDGLEKTVAAMGGAFQSAAVNL